MGATPPHSPGSRLLQTASFPFPAAAAAADSSVRIVLLSALLFLASNPSLLIPVALFCLPTRGSGVPIHHCTAVSGGRNSSVLGCPMANENRSKKNYEEASPEPVHPRGTLGRPLLLLSITLQPQCCSFHHESIVWMVLVVLPRASWLLNEGLTLRFCSPRQQRNPRSQNTWMMVIAPLIVSASITTKAGSPFVSISFTLMSLPAPPRKLGATSSSHPYKPPPWLLLKPKSYSIQTVSPQTLKVLPPTLASPFCPHRDRQS